MGPLLPRNYLLSRFLITEARLTLAEFSAVAAAPSTSA